MKTHVSYIRSAIKKFSMLFVVLNFALSVAFSVVVLPTFAQPTNTVIVTPTTDISNQYPGQANSSFIQSFWATGVNDDKVEFIGVWWPTSDPSDVHTVSGIGVRAANTPANKKTEVTLEIPYSSGGMNPNTAYSYEIRDVFLGKVYYSGSFTSPANNPSTPTGPVNPTQPTTPTSPTYGAGVVNGLTVIPSVSADGLTVTFTIIDTPASGHDADFVLSYGSGFFFSGAVQNFGTRSITATAPQTLTFTLPTNQGFVVDSQNFVVDPKTVTYSLNDEEGNVYVTGTFGSPTAPAGPTTPTTPVTPKPKDSNKVAKDTAPDMSGGLVPCDGRLSVKRCGWGELIKLVNDVIKWIIYASVPIAAALFSYAGFLYLTNGASEEARAKAKGIFINVAVGFVFVLIAVLLIKTVLAAFGVDGAYSLFL